jgi:adenine-specific DNA-methyltransferase
MIDMSGRRVSHMVLNGESWESSITLSDDPGCFQFPSIDDDSNILSKSNVQSVKKAWAVFLGQFPDEAQRGKAFKLFWMHPETPLSQIHPLLWGQVYESVFLEKKQAGVYYTPVQVAQYLVEETLKPVLNGFASEMQAHLGLGDFSQAIRVLKTVMGLTILDPACGCGVFLGVAFQHLMGFYQHIHTLFQAFPQTLPEETLFKETFPLWPGRHILTYQLYGVDIDEKAVWITLRSLEALAQLGESHQFENSIAQESVWRVGDTASNYRVGNALVSQRVSETGPIQFTEEIKKLQIKRRSLKQLLYQGNNPGDAAEFIRNGNQVKEFYWETAFPERFLPTMAEGQNLTLTFDFILGNPPYLVEARDNAALFRWIRESSRVSHQYHSKMDLCDAFVFLGLSFLPSKGRLGFVLPEYWTQRSSSEPLRQKIWAETTLDLIWRFGTYKIFPRAPGHHTTLVILTQKTPESGCERGGSPLSAQSHYEALSSQLCWLGEVLAPDDALSSTRSSKPMSVFNQGEIFREPRTGKFLMGSVPEISLLKRLASMPPLLNPSGIQQGVVLPQGRLRGEDWEKLSQETKLSLKPGAGIFVVTPEEKEALGLNTLEKALLKPYYEPQGFQPFTGFRFPEPLFFLIYADATAKERIQESPAQYPNICRHLEQFHSINTSAHKPYGLHRARNAHWFEGSDGRILGLRQTEFPCFGWVPYPSFVNESFYCLAPAPTQGESFAWLGILNSTLAWYWFYAMKRKGTRLQIDKDILTTLPRPLDVDLREAPWIEIVEGLVTENFSHPSQEGSLNSGVDFEINPETKQTLNLLNAQIYQAYGCSESEIHQVETLKARLG